MKISKIYRFREHQMDDHLWICAPRWPSRWKEEYEKLERDAKTEIQDYESDSD